MERKECQFCKESIKETATVCPRCGRHQIDEDDLKGYGALIAYARGEHKSWAFGFGIITFIILNVFIDIGLGYAIFLAIIFGILLGKGMLGHEGKKLASHMTVDEIDEEFQVTVRDIEIIRVKERLSLLIFLGIVISLI